jgi:glutamate---cysteine ligase / carboxylate-amine ligase
VKATFVDPFRRQPMNAADWLNEVLDFIDQDIDALQCRGEIERLNQIIKDGTSADRQIAIYGKARAAGRQRLTALKDVVDWAAAETQAF